ncbi:MAG: SDR family oxidoreductase [Pseudomonadales bacterium]|nr:SDR family oxidoreductase [Pseudomonadales bacterium]
MELGLDGRNVLVAGASRGIGRGIAETFLAEGACVLLTGRDEVALAATETVLAAAHPGCVAAWSGDMTATDGIVTAFAALEKRFGAADVLVANVGGGYLVPGWDVGDAELEQALEHNLTGTVRLVREGVRRMQREQAVEPGAFAPNIVVVSSIAGVDVMGAPFAYGIAKSGLNHFVGSMARVVGPGMRVNAVAPGNILFEGGSWERSRAAAPERIERWIRREVALKRFGTVEEIADVVAFLASPRASFVTGATWIADGGQVRSSA